MRSSDFAGPSPRSSEALESAGCIEFAIGTLIFCALERLSDASYKRRQMKRTASIGFVVFLLAACNGGATTASDAGADAAQNCARAAQAPVQVMTPTGSLVGELDTPDGCGPYPLFLLYPGSGPTDRDGNDTAARLSTDAYKELSTALSASGIASVRYDKRGVGDSAAALPADVSAFTFDDDVADARLWAQQYVHDARFRSLTLVGHSEGSLWAILIAEDVPVAAVISLEGSARSLGDVLTEQLGNQLGVTSPLFMQAKQIITSLEAGMTVSTVPPQLDSLFDPSVQQYLISWMKYDPAQELAKLKQPILVVQGSTDTEVDVKDGQQLVAANSNAQLVPIDGMCHVLKDAALATASQQAAYTDPTLPLDTTLVTNVESFLHGLP